MTINDLRQSAIDKGLKFEIKTLKEFEGFKEIEIGIRYRNYIWAWWSASAFNEKVSSIDNEYAFFIHTYNQNVGRIDKSFRREVSVENQLKRISDKTALN